MARRGDDEEQADTGRGKNDRKRRRAKNERPDAAGVTEEDLGWLADLRQAREEKADIGPGPGGDTGRRRAATTAGDSLGTAATGDSRHGATQTGGSVHGAAQSADGRHGGAADRDSRHSSAQGADSRHGATVSDDDGGDVAPPRRSRRERQPADPAPEQRKQTSAGDRPATPAARDSATAAPTRRGVDDSTDRGRGEDTATRRRGDERPAGRRRAEERQAGRPVSSPPVSTSTPPVSGGPAPGVPGPRSAGATGEFERVRPPRPEQAPGSRFVSVSGLRRHTGSLPVVQPTEQRPVPPTAAPPTPPRVPPPAPPVQPAPPKTPPRATPATPPSQPAPPAAARATPAAPPAAGDPPRTGRPTPTMPVGGRAIPPGARILPPPPPGTETSPPVPPARPRGPAASEPVRPAAAPGRAAGEPVRAATASTHATASARPDGEPKSDALTGPTRSQVRAELRRQLTRTRRLRRLTLAALVVVLLGGLPMVFLIRDAVQDPVFAGLKSLDVPGWAAANPQSQATGSRLCIRVCRYRELQLSSARGTDETDAAYRHALTKAGWDPAPGGRCPDRTEGKYSCWQRDEYVLDLWTRQAQCDQQAPATRPTASPSGTPDPSGSAAPGGGQGAGDPGCSGSLVTLKVTNRIDPNWHV